MRTLSLRSRLLIGTVGLLAVGLLIAGITGLMLFRSFLIQRLDEQLQTPFGTNPPPPAKTWLAELCNSSEAANTLQLPTNFTILVTDARGTTTCRLPAQPPPGTSPIPIDTDSLANAADNASILELGPTGPPEARWHARVVRVETGYAVIAVSLAEVETSVARLAAITLTVGLVILAAAVLAGTAVVRIGLRPLTRIEHTAEDIAAGDLTRRVDVGTPNTEIGRLGTALNTMLAQIETAFTERDRTEQRLRRFVADASHELRTPIATIRGHAELVRNGVASHPEDVTRLVGRIESESIRMTSLVDDLLLLARLDTTPALESKPTDLLSIAAETLAGARIRHPGLTIQLRNPTDPPWQDQPPVVIGDNTRLGQVLANLVNNAVQHTPPGTPIEIEVGVIDGHARVAVIDHGPGLRPGNETRVFERFFREDAGRGRTNGGAGLGLAIASNLIDKHGGTLGYQPTPRGGSTFQIDLPLDRE